MPRKALDILLLQAETARNQDAGDGEDYKQKYATAMRQVETLTRQLAGYQADTADAKQAVKAAQEKRDHLQKELDASKLEPFSNIEEAELFQQLKNKSAELEEVRAELRNKAGETEDLKAEVHRLEQSLDEKEGLAERLTARACAPLMSQLSAQSKVMQEKDELIERMQEGLLDYEDMQQR